MDLDNLLDEFARYKKAITLDEIVFNAEDMAPISLILKKMREDERFISLHSTKNNQKCVFLPKKFILDEFLDLNASIGSQNISFIDLSRLKKYLIFSFNYPFTDNEIIKVLSFAEKYLLISVISESLFSFPLSNIALYLKSVYHFSWKSTLLKICEEVFKASGSEKIFEDNLNTFIISNINHPREYRILQLRFGLKNGQPQTLEEVGKVLGLTRERIRQIENRFFKKLHLKHKELIWERSFWWMSPEPTHDPVRLFLLFYFTHGGNNIYLLFRKKEISTLQFLCKISGYPFQISEKLNCLILGVGADSIEQIEKLTELKTKKEEQIFPELLKIEGLSLSKTDVALILDLIKKITIEKIKLADIICEALRTLGKPAHYTEIARTCNKLYPMYIFTPRNILAVLCRKDLEGKIWVWTGSRGIYALKEWGYERPTESIHETVYHIVKEKYEETKKPVSLNYIKSKFAEKRRFFKNSSLAMACYTNSKIKVVVKDHFIPADSIEEKQSENDKLIEKLDSKLREIDF